MFVRVNQHGKTALHEALSSTGNMQIVKSLLLHGADPNTAPKVLTASTLLFCVVCIVLAQKHMPGMSRILHAKYLCRWEFLKQDVLDTVKITFIICSISHVRCRVIPS